MDGVDFPGKKPREKHKEWRLIAAIQSIADNFKENRSCVSSSVEDFSETKLITRTLDDFSRGGKTKEERQRRKETNGVSKKMR